MTIVFGASIERWLPVVGFDGFYEVSDAGRIRSLSRMIRSSFGATKRHQGRLLKTHPDKDGYPKIILHVDGKYHTRYLHRLVADAFHRGMQNALHNEVDHIDGDRANARAANLRWVSRGENHFYRRGGRRAIKASMSPLTEVHVREIRATPMKYGTATALANRLGVPRMAIYDVLRGRTWRHLK